MLSHFGHVWLFVTLWTVARQAPLYMGFSRQECCSGLPFPPPGDLPNPGVKLVSLTSPALADGFFTTNAIWEAPKDTQAPFLLSGFLNSSPTCFSSCLSQPAVMFSGSALLSLCQWWKCRGTPAPISKQLWLQAPWLHLPPALVEKPPALHPPPPPAPAILSSFLHQGKAKG